MNLDDITYGDIKSLVALFGNQLESVEKDHLIGQYVLIRCASAGVHCGILASQKADVVELTGSRRLWSWTAKSGVALSGVAQSGLSAGKVDTINPFIRLTGAIETILCSDAARYSINDFSS